MEKTSPDGQALPAREPVVDISHPEHRLFPSCKHEERGTKQIDATNQVLTFVVKLIVSVNHRDILINGAAVFQESCPKRNGLFDQVG